MVQVFPLLDVAERLYAIAESIPQTGFGGHTYQRPFIEVMHRLDRAQHGIAGEDIESVRQAYMNLEDWGWDGGFLVELRDGRRAMIDASADDFDWGKTTLTVEVKPAGFDYLSPEVPRTHQVRLYGFVDELPEITLFLERLAAASIDAGGYSGHHAQQDRH